MSEIKLLKDTLHQQTTPYVEVEYKYYAEHVDRMAFLNLFPTPHEKVVSSFDYYFKPMYGNSRAFMRYRASSTPELTVKTPINGNFVRNEVDIPLSDTSEAAIREFAKLLNFDFSFSIYKTCSIIKCEHLVYSYYKVFDPNFTPMNTFIEVELDKKSGRKAYELEQGKALLSKIGLNDNNICTKSLFELYSN